MGMYANYQEITKEELDKLHKAEDLMECVEELQENEDTALYDLDKMWDALHFLLTGVSACMPIEENPLSEAVVGEEALSSDDEEYNDTFVAVISQERVKIIAQALEKTDTESYFDKFDMKNFAKNEIYPNIWEYEEEEEEIIDDLKGHFENIKNFYKEMAEKNSAVLVSIY